MDWKKEVPPPGEWEIRPQARWRLVGLAGAAAIDALCATCRVRVEGREQVAAIMESRRFILCFWHARILVVAWAHQHWGSSIMVSRSEDGEIIAQVVRRQGHHPVRGSSTRGGAEAMEVLVNKLKHHVHPAGIIPDGPQGPRYVVQPGAVTLARKTGYPILPVTFSARRRWVAPSWDRFVVPRPFSECLLLFGRPIHVPADLDLAGREDRRKALEKELNRITLTADRRFGQQTP